MKIIAAAVCLLVATTSAHAAPYQFTLTGFSTASFTLDSNPVPTTTDGVSFTVGTTAGQFFNGNGQTITAAPLRFFLAGTAGGGFTVLDPNQPSNFFIDLEGSQLFSNSLALPIFQPGTYQLTDVAPGKADQLVIAALPVPEPASWTVALLALAGVVAYRRRVG